MKIYQAFFDCTTITIIAKTEAEAITYLLKRDNSFHFDFEKQKLYFKWSDDLTEEVDMEDVTNSRGIIQYETH